MYSAVGTRAPTLVMFPYKEKVPKNIIQKCPKDFGIGCSDNGWMTLEAFYEYITLIFYPWLVEKKIQFPVVIYFDGHASHMTIPLVSFCRNKQIELISLYPNATHIMQPLDIAFFHPFKEVWRKFLAKWKNENNKKMLTREDFSIVLKLALDSYSQAKETIIGGFKAAGLMLFNPNAPDYNVLDKKKKKKSKNKETVHPAEEMEENKQISDDAALDDKKRYLKIFERDLPLELLQEFKDNKDGGVWTGAIERDGLFHYWLKIQNEANESSERSVIKSVESLNYDKDKSIDSSDSSHEKQPVTLNDSSVLQVEVANVASAQEKDETNLSSDGLSTIISDNIILRTTSEDEQADVPLLNLGGLLYPLDEVQFVQEIPIDHSTIDSDYQMDPAALQNITQAQYAEPELNVLNNNLNEGTTNLSKDSPCVDTCILKENCNHQALENTSQSNTDVDSVSIETEKLEKKGKPKLPAVGTGDAWLKILEEQENERKIKEEKIAKRKNYRLQRNR